MRRFFVVCAVCCAAVCSGVAGCVPARAGDVGDVGGAEDASDAAGAPARHPHDDDKVKGDDAAGSTVAPVEEEDVGEDVVVNPHCQVLVLRQECVADHCIALLKRHC